MIEHSKYKEPNLKDRYITLDMLTPCFKKVASSSLRVLGKSVQGDPISAFTLGHGKHRVLMWSQMHGNESTTTKAAWDMVNYLQGNETLAKTILDSCTLMVVPMLNPDGAKAYTRVNANQIDLNRDAQQRSQPESKVLRELFEAFKPDFCFNLHDQRTLFSAGSAKKPATVSFLSPASNEQRDVTPSREVAMKLIVAMNRVLQELIPGRIGRYDDGFNANCVGDAFQMQGVPTILFEAGHYEKDYMREHTREYIFHALMAALDTISKEKIDEQRTEDYYRIPENEKWFFDILIQNPQTINSNLEKGSRIGIRFQEILEGNAIQFKPELAEIGKLEGFFGHETFNCLNKKDLEQLSKHNEIMALIKRIEK